MTWRHNQGAIINIKMPSCQYRHSHVKDKTGIPIPGKDSLYIEMGPRYPCDTFVITWRSILWDGITYISLIYLPVAPKYQNDGWETECMPFFLFLQLYNFFNDFIVHLKLAPGLPPGGVTADGEGPEGAGLLSLLKPYGVRRSASK